jgi:hypothetical protein
VGRLANRVSETHRPSPFLFAAVVGKVEGKDAFVIGGALKHFRASGALPAISAPLMAPIEMPAIQSGCRSALVNAS